MKPTYEIVKSSFMGIETETLKRTDSDGLVSWIPMVAGNADYEAYLNPDKVEHLTEISTPEQSGTL